MYVLSVYNLQTEPISLIIMCGGSIITLSFYCNVTERFIYIIYIYSLSFQKVLCDERDDVRALMSCIWDLKY